MAAIYGLAEGDQVHVRRIRAASVELRSVMLVPLDASVPSEIGTSIYAMSFSLANGFCKK
jgi:hypothetical protein